MQGVLVKLLWLDLETTGLDPSRCGILEVAAFTADLADPFSRTSDVVQSVLPLHPLEWDALDPFVRKMHTDNGLLEACRSVPEPVGDLDPERALEQRLLALIPKKEDVRREDLTALAGSSVHFDLGFLRVHMPELASHLSHRVYDVSAVALFCRSLGMPKLPRADAHRALPDVEASVAVARACADWLCRVPAALQPA